VRLNDHFRAHEILRRIRGRLTDYVELWERDRACMFMGMLYQKAGTNFAISREGKSIKFSTDGSDETTLWKKDEGFARHLKFVEHVGKLNPQDREQFQHYFLGYHKEHYPRDENRRDKARREEIAAKLGRGAKGAKKRFNYMEGPGKIRAHFAHLKPFSDTDPDEKLRKRNGRLTYLINAVRSLLAYDRKLKNAVSKSIIDLMAKEGMALDWEMNNDRLRSPRIGPRLEQHLSFLPRENEGDSFELPQVSPRLASLMQGLFYFESGGHQLGDLDGEITYPAWITLSPRDREIWKKLGKSGSEIG